MKKITSEGKSMNKSRIVIFSDLHYAPEKPINNGSKIERKLMELVQFLVSEKALLANILRIIIY